MPKGHAAGRARMDLPGQREARGHHGLLAAGRHTGRGLEAAAQPVTLHKGHNLVIKVTDKTRPGKYAIKLFCTRKVGQRQLPSIRSGHQKGQDPEGLGGLLTAGRTRPAEASSSPTDPVSAARPSTAAERPGTGLLSPDPGGRERLTVRTSEEVPRERAANRGGGRDHRRGRRPDRQPHGVRGHADHRVRHLGRPARPGPGHRHAAAGGGARRQLHRYRGLLRPSTSARP